MKNIIVEGVECGGKTTLINEIRRKVDGWDLKFLSHKDDDQFERYMWEYLTNNGTIFNRSHFSEVVYSRLWDRKEPFTEYQKKALDETAKNDSIIILCSPDKELMKERYMSRDFSQKAKLGELENIHGLFLEVFDEIPCMVYGSENMNALYEAASKVEKMIKTGQRCY